MFGKPKHFGGSCYVYSWHKARNFKRSFAQSVVSKKLQYGASHENKETVY